MKYTRVMGDDVRIMVTFDTKVERDIFMDMLDTLIRLMKEAGKDEK